MADLQFVDFALMAGQVRKENQSRLPEVFSSIDVTILSRTRHSVSGFRAHTLPSTTRTDRCSAIREMFYTTRAKQEISTFPLSEVEIVAY